MFQSRATNLTTNQVSSANDNLFARDLATGETLLLNVHANGTTFSGDASDVAISASGRTVVYSLFQNINGSVTTFVCAYDLLTRTNAIVCTNCKQPTSSGDGRWVAFVSTTSRQVMLKDLQTGVTIRLSTSIGAAAGDGNGASSSPLLTYDGRYVVFASRASDLVNNDTNAVQDIFVRDLLAGTTLLVTMNQAGTASANATSSKPILGADGRTVLFQSFASDLVDRDFNANRDIFALRLGAGDADGDGLDDDWEMTYFGTLARDGTSDFDDDGLTDAQEYRAGTDPASGASVLRVLTLTLPGGAGTTVLWSAVPGKTYRVQSKDSADAAAWSEFPGLVTAPGSTASYVDTTGSPSGHRFYRVALGE